MSATKIVEKLFELDPEETMLCLEDMMRKKISRPAHLMYDGCDQNIFDKFALVAQKIETPGSISRGQQAQDYVCGLPSPMRKLEELAGSRVRKWPKTAAFSWIFNQEVTLI
ncbi:hypothetical protein L7F22_038783 [Adiantum nelumboides]|nr:hypothetical protein [Adiantum nelumboides]